MAVYVDAAIHRWRDMLWCHLIADDEAELHEFAERLGLKREWYQTDSVLRHYDIPKHTREEAIAMGAVQISRAQMVSRIRSARAGGATRESLPTPNCDLREACKRDPRKLESSDWPAFPNGEQRQD